jgi:hypothetical protein
MSVTFSLFLDKLDDQMAQHEDCKSADDCKSLADEDRRKFLASAGRFAAVTGPAITLLLSTSLSSKAIAYSGGMPTRTLTE